MGRVPPGACAGGTGLPGFAAGTAEDAHCWGAQGRFSAAAKLPPEDQRGEDIFNSPCGRKFQFLV